MGIKGLRNKKETRGSPPRVTPPKDSARVDNGAAPKVAPPKAWDSSKPPGGKLPETSEQPVSPESNS